MKTKGIKVIISALTILTSLFIFQKQTKAATVDSPIVRKVWVVEYDPRIPSEGNQRLSQLVGAYNPSTLVDQYINELKARSSNYINYQVVGWTERDEVAPLKNTDGFEYTKDGFWDCYQNDTIQNPACHEAENMREVDYLEMISDNTLCAKSNQYTADEVWFFDSGHMGFSEAVMAGPSNLYHTNGPPVTAPACQRHLHMMGFNQTRTVDWMEHSFMHRIEGTLAHAVFFEEPRTPPYPHASDWGKFMMTKQTWPGNAGCGLIHFPPNTNGNWVIGNGDDYNNTTTAKSYCNDFLLYPDLPDPPNYQYLRCGITGGWNCTGGSQVGFIAWWLDHLPKFKGTNPGGIGGATKLSNWWRYTVNYNLCKIPVMNLTTWVNDNLGGCNITWSWQSTPEGGPYDFQVDNSNPLTSPYLINLSKYNSNSYTVTSWNPGIYSARVRTNANFCISSNSWSTVDTNIVSCGVGGGE